MKFDDLPIIPAQNVFRAALVSVDAGEAALRDLHKKGVVHPMRTPTGRTLLTPADGRRLFEALQARAAA